jgi:hypothetical protein
MVRLATALIAIQIRRTDGIAEEEGEVKNGSDEGHETQQESVKVCAPHHVTHSETDTWYRVIASSYPNPTPQQHQQQHQQKHLSRKVHVDSLWNEEERAR